MIFALMVFVIAGFVIGWPAAIGVAMATVLVLAIVGLFARALR